MITGKIAAWGTGIIFLAATLLPGQTVIEAAKKEKERRDSVKGIPVVVVTNADLIRTKKKPAVIQPSAEAASTGVTSVPAATAPRPSPVPAAAPPYQNIKAEQAKLFEQEKTDIEGRLKAAGEYVSLLKLKMTALQQQFYNFSNTTSRDQIQKDISETYQKLQAASAEEAKIKAELDRHEAAGPIR
jgi:hypothetical protein